MTGLRGLAGSIGDARHVLLAALVGFVMACGTPAASAGPSAAQAGDPRSSGQGPGLVGDPLVAIAAVVAIGLAAIILTLAYIRVTDRRRG
jgi:hypothetical protein